MRSDAAWASAASKRSEWAVKAASALAMLPLLPLAVRSALAAAIRLRLQLDLAACFHRRLRLRRRQDRASTHKKERNSAPVDIVHRRPNGHKYCYPAK